VGTEDFESGTFICYPNPGNQFVTVQFARRYTGVIELWSLTGNLILQYKANSEFSKTIDVSAIQNGLYILRTESGMAKLIIE